MPIARDACQESQVRASPAQMGVRARIHHFTQTTPKKKTVHRRNSMNVCIYNIAIRKRRRPPFEKEHERERASVLHGNGMEWSSQAEQQRQEAERQQPTEGTPRFSTERTTTRI